MRTFKHIGEAIALEALHGLRLSWGLIDSRRQTIRLALARGDVPHTIKHACWGTGHGLWEQGTTL